MVKINVIISFSPMRKIPEKNNFKEGKIYFAHGGSPWSTVSIALGLSRGRISWQNGTVEESSLIHGSQETEKERGKGHKREKYFQGTTPVTYFQLDPTFQ